VPRLEEVFAGASLSSQRQSFVARRNYTTAAPRGGRFGYNRASATPKEDQVSHRLCRLSPPLLALALAAALLVGLALLRHGEPEAAQAADLAQSGRRVRVVHAIPDAPPLDVYLDGARIAEGISFFDASRYGGPYPAGEYLVELREAGAPPSGTPILSRTLQLSESLPYDYSISALGTLTTTDSAAARISFFVDLDNAPPAGQGRFALIHAAPDAPSVDILIDGTRTYTDVAYRDVRGYLPVAPGTYTVAVAAVGGAPFYTTTASIRAGESVTLWASGLLGGPARTRLSAFALRASYDNVAGLRLLHAFPEAEAVDVYLGTERVASALAYGTLTPYLPQLAGSYSVSVVAAGTTSELVSTTVRLDGSGDYTLAAISRVVTPSASLQLSVPGLALFEDAHFLPAVQRARLRLTHLAPNTPSAASGSVDALLDGSPAVDNLGYLQASGYLNPPAGVALLDIRDPGGSASVLSETLGLDPGSVVSVYLIGGSGGRPLQALRVNERGASLVLRLPLLARLEAGDVR
jgi:hypothetical protein